MLVDRVIYLRPTRIAPRRPASRFASILEQADRDGLFVLPACADPAQKHPCVEWKELQTRRPSVAETRDWLARFPGRNGVYVLGPILGRFVLDLDDRAAADWVAQRGVPPTQTVRTRKGWHLHLAYPDFKVYNPVGQIYPGVDVRGFAGVAVAVGSVHQSGFRYRWATSRSPQNIPLAPAPEWLLDWLRQYAAKRENVVHLEPRPFQGRVSAWARCAIDAELDQLRHAPDGTRNASLAHAAFKLGQLVGAGEADKTEIRAAVYEIADAWPDVEKSKSTIDRCVEAGACQPRYRREVS
jgi:Bifunctional DNA primase/polymerase, N-terminal